MLKKDHNLFDYFGTFIDKKSASKKPNIKINNTNFVDENLDTKKYIKDKLLEYTSINKLFGNELILFIKKLGLMNKNLLLVYL